MALETATYINDLVVTNPATTDNVQQGDDHLRLLKSTIKATFPNITAAVTPTAVQINKLTVDGVTVSPGMMLLWPSAYAIPTGWRRANGGTITGLGTVPNMSTVEPAGCYYIIKT